ncbi:MAG: M16 family metallopeptidase [Rhizomicrobium sp.]
MTFFIRWASVAFAFLLFALPVAAEDAAPVTPWPQLTSDLPADPDVLFGTLPNGMRYAIRKNNSPKGAVSVRLRMAVGSLMERDNEQGIAHMLEHMAFRGSRNVADGDVVRKLQSLGLTFGADTNAFTQATQTVYMFDMPKNDAASIDTSILLMREIAGNLNIDQSALDTERNVVLAEAHLRDVPAAHLQKSSLSFLYGGRTASALTPIGLEDVIAHANARLVRDFYDTWYRPERATLVIVGDVDPAEIEAKIKASFSDWKARAPARKAITYTPPAQHPAPVKLFVEPGAQTFVMFDWIKPFDATPDSKAEETREVMRFAALAVINQRFSALAHGANPPFISAVASHDHVGNVADATEIDVNYRSGEGIVGLKTAERAWRDAVANGVRQDELDQVIAQLRTFFQSNATAAETTTTSFIANSLAHSLDENSVYTSPAADLVLFNEVAKGMTVQNVSAALRETFTGTGPLIFVSSTSPMPGGEAAIMSALAEADSTPLAATQAIPTPVWPYMAFGVTGKVASRSTVADLGVSFVRFANGVTLTVKPTQFRAGQILINVRFGQGRLGLPRDQVAPAWSLGGVFVQGGLKRYSTENLQRRMADKVWGASLGIGDDAFTLSGFSRAADLSSELQVLAAYFTDAAWKPEAYDQVRVADAGVQAETEAAPSSLLSREFYGLVHDGDARWRAPTLGEINASTVDQAKAIVAPAMASGPLEIIIVGDVTVDQAIAAVAPTFGALPHRSAAGSPPSGDEHFPKPQANPVQLTHKGAANQAVAAIAWPTNGFFPDMQQPCTLRVLAEIFSQRLLDELRTREGITYTPGASTYSSLVTPDYGFIYALAQIPPDKIATFYDVVAHVADDLKTKPVSTDELERARGPRIEDILRQQQTNEYWLSLVAGAQADPRRLDVIRTTIPDLKAITAEDLQKSAQTWLLSDKAFKIVVVPGAPVPAQDQN